MIYKNLSGTTKDTFSLGLKSDKAVLTPNQTKRNLSFLDEVSGKWTIGENPILVSFSIDGNSPPVSGTYTELYGFCHTTGGVFTAGELYYDTGTVIVPVKVFYGLSIVTTSAIVGVVSLGADTLYSAESDIAPHAWTSKAGSGGTSYHPDLTGRQEPDSHPITAITNLTEELYTKRDKICGLVNRNDCEVLHDTLTNTYTVQPKAPATSFDIWSGNTLFNVTAPMSITLPVVDEEIIVCIDSNGDLVTSNDLNIDNEPVSSWGLLSYVFCNIEDSRVISVQDLRYCVNLSVSARNTFILMFGTFYRDGLAITNITADGSGDLDIHAQIQVEAGRIVHTDFLTSIDEFLFPANIPIIYKHGTSWNAKLPDAFPMVYTGTVGTDYTGTLVPYNFIDPATGIGSLIESPNNDFLCIHIFAGNGVNSGIFGIQGQFTYTTRNNARRGALDEIKRIIVTEFISRFFTPIGSLIIQTGTGRSNVPHAEIVSTDQGDDYIDLRLFNSVVGSGSDDFVDAPLDGLFYGREDGAWIEGMNKVEISTELLSKMNWRNNWADGTYEKNDVVRDDEWTMVANKQTTDQPSPIALGDPEWLFPDNPIWDVLSYNGQVLTGININNLPFGTLFAVDTLRIWIQDIRPTVRYRIVYVNNVTGSKIVGSTFFGDELLSIGFFEFNLLSTYWLDDTSDYSFYVIAQNIESSVLTNINYTYIDRDRDPADTDPGIGNVTYNRDQFWVRLSTTDADGNDQTAFLDSLVSGSDITITSTPTTSNWIKFNVVDIEGSYSGYRVFNCVLLDQGDSRPDKDNLSDVEFDQPIPASVDYVSNTDFFISNPSISGRIELDSSGIIINNNAYMCDIHYQEYEESLDWDVLAHSASIGSGSPVDDLTKYKEPLDTGLVSGGILTANTGLTLSVEAGTGVVVDSTTNPLNAIATDVDWIATDVTLVPSSTVSHEIHEIYVDSAGVVRHIPIENKTPEFAYTNISLGWAEIEANVVVSISMAPHAVAQTAYNVSDLFKGITDESKATGLRIQPSSGLGIYIEKGRLLIPGIGWHTNRRHQNVLELSQSGDELNPITLSIYNLLGESVIAPQSDLPKYYDDTGILEPLTGNEAVIHYVFYTAKGYSIQLGQTPYKNFSEAFRNIDEDINTFTFAPASNVSSKSILLGVVIISKLAEDFVNKSLADIVSTINGETGNTIAPIDLTLVPQYLLHTTASEDLVMGDLLSMNVNGDLQKYPATGGEGQSQYTTDNVDVQSAIFLDNTNNQGVICWRNNISLSTLYYRVAQGNSDGSVSYSPVASLTVAGTITDIGLKRIGNDRSGLSVSSTSEIRIAIIRNNGIGSAPSIANTRQLDTGNITSCDVCYDWEQNNLLGAWCNAGTTYQRYCPVSSYNIDNMPDSRTTMTSGTVVRCVSEGGNVITVSVSGTTSYWRECAWDKPWLGSGDYDDKGTENTQANCSEHCGLQVQSGVILAQFENAGSMQTYQATYSSGNSMGAISTYGTAKAGKSADLIKTTSGIGYSIILKANGVIEIWEGTLQGTYELVYSTTLNIGTNVTSIQALMFGSVFAVGAVGDYVWANQVILIDSSVTRTDHFIAVAPYDVLQGQKFDADIALPLITLPREYASGTMYEYGPYKYQVITHNQAVIIIEATTMITT